MTPVAAPATGWRRVTAYLVDYLVIAAYIALLTGVSFMLPARVRGWPLALSGNPILGQLLAFVALTLPVVLYFAVSEASLWQGTLGKHALKHPRSGARRGRAALVPVAPCCARR